MIIKPKYFRTELWKSLTRSEKDILRYLFTFSDKNGKNCYPSYTKLSEVGSMRRNTISKAILELERKKAIKINRAEGKKNGYDMSIWTSIEKDTGTSSPFEHD